MGRTITLENHLSSEELKARYQSSTDPVESRRWHLLWLVSQQWYLLDAAASVGVSYSYARKVVYAYNQDGVGTIMNQRRGRQMSSRALLSADQQAELDQALQAPPADGGLWSGPKVAQWIARKTGRAQVHSQRGWDYLQRLNYSGQRPRPRHANANEEAQTAFKKTYPNESSN
ncbi:winged helix-turn-helix domain-containing protein [Leptolyngbya sp. GB1-A1]|uniref:helix-turn-helix domain-containing protein n=1 Tax=Leptolyngbya sp. GB1-A1 TaxID=2933908 RepID=UPI00329881A0